MVTPTPTTVQVKIQLRRDTAANWASVNPILLAGEMGLETDTNRVKIGNGSTIWNSLGYFPFVVSGGTVLGNLEIGSTGTLTFEGSTADGFETTLGVVDPTADRTINLPNQSGTVIVSGNASIVDADIAANAEIAVGKLANGTANQVIVTDGTNVSWSDDLTLAGNLTVNGTTTTVNTETLVVEDKNIELGVVGTPTDLTADGGGITLKGTTDKTINWIDATDAWTSSERFSVPLGSAASPSLTFTGDENSGLYSPGADQLALSTNGAGRLFVDASGNVGVGVSSPTDKLEVDGKLKVNASAGPAQILLAQAGTTNGIISASGGAGFDIGLASGRFTTLTSVNGTVFYSAPSLGGAATERARIDSSGRLLVGTSGAISTGSITPTLQNTGSTTQAASIGINAFSTNTAIEPRINFTKSATTTIGSNVLVANGESLGSLRFYGSQSAGYIQAATIECYVDGDPETAGDTTDMPGRLVFSTTADGASIPTERIRITSTGQVRLAGAGITFNGDTASANELDDYEEGTWTPVFADASSGGNTATYTAVSATYVKIGKLVTVWTTVVDIDTTGLTAANDLFVRGLPFAAALIDSIVAIAPGSVTGSFVTATQPLTTELADGTSFLRFTEFVSGASLDRLTVSQLTSGSADLYFSVSYEAA